MERLVRDLLRLAGLDARQETARDVRLPAAAAAGGGGRRPRPRDRRAAPAGGRAGRIPTSPSSAPTRRNCRTSLRNLVENAVNYSPEGRRIEVAAAAGGGGVPHHRLGRGARASPKRPRTHVRTVLPGGQGAVAGIGRHGARACRSSNTSWSCSAVACGRPTARKAARVHDQAPARFDRRPS